MNPKVDHRCQPAFSTCLGTLSIKLSKIDRKKLKYSRIDVQKNRRSAATSEAQTNVWKSGNERQPTIENW